MFPHVSSNKHVDSLSGFASPLFFLYYFFNSFRVVAVVVVVVVVVFVVVVVVVVVVAVSSVLISELETAVSSSSSHPLHAMLRTLFVPVHAGNSGNIPAASVGDPSLSTSLSLGIEQLQSNVAISRAVHECIVAAGTSLRPVDVSMLAYYVLQVCCVCVLCVCV